MRSLSCQRMLGALSLAILLLGCQAHWGVPLREGDRLLHPLSGEAWHDVASQVPAEVRDDRALPLERVLWYRGVRTVQAVQIGQDVYEAASLDADLWLLRNGCLQAGTEVACGTSVIVTAATQAADVTIDLTDLAPTLAQALAVPAPRMATGHALGPYHAAHAILVVLDGLGYDQVLGAISQGRAPFLGSLEGLRAALSVYFSVTRAATAAMLTGTTPERNGVLSNAMRSTHAETIFDCVGQAGKRVVAVEGSILAFNLRRAELLLSADRDGDGSSDDDVLANAQRVTGQGMPDLLWVHFHGIDDTGHTYGPGSAQLLTKIAEVDAHLRELLAALPPFPARWC